MGTEISLSPLSCRDKTNGNGVWKTTYPIRKLAQKHNLGVPLKGFLAVLVSAGIELIFFSVGVTELCFGFSVKIILITHRCLVSSHAYPKSSLLSVLC